MVYWIGNAAIASKMWVMAKTIKDEEDFNFNCKNKKKSGSQGCWICYFTHLISAIFSELIWRLTNQPLSFVRRHELQLFYKLQFCCNFQPKLKTILQITNFSYFMFSDYWVFSVNVPYVLFTGVVGLGWR